jgi:hypothetical protein
MPFSMVNGVKVTVPNYVQDRVVMNFGLEKISSSSRLKEGFNAL